MSQAKTIAKVSALCKLRLYDEAIRLTDTIQNKLVAVKAHLLCIEHEQRARLDGNLYDYRESNMYDKDFHLHVAARKEQWLSNYGMLPSEIYVMEFFGKGDHFFGGNADDRLLCENGNIWDGRYPKPASKIFLTIEEAASAASLITNRRDASILGLIPYWEWEINDK